VSTYDINVPQADQIDYHSDLCQQRRQAALKALDIGDVLAQVDDLISQEPDPQKHPCYGLVAFCWTGKSPSTAVNSGTPGNGWSSPPSTPASMTCWRWRTRPCSIPSPISFSSPAR
jgi:hypothetical protein